MSYSTQDEGLKDAAILNQVIENLLKKLIRLLIGKISLARFQEIVSRVFVQEAERFLASESRGGMVSLSKLGAITELDTRALKKIRASMSHPDPSSSESQALIGFNPLLKIVDLWMNDERFFDATTGLPRKLAMRPQDNESSFADLVAASGTVRGVTVASVLQRLESAQLVDVDSRNGQIALRADRPSFVRKGELEMLEIGINGATQLLSSVSYNVTNRADANNRFFQRSFWNYQIHPDQLPEVRQQLHTFLCGVEKDGRALITGLAETVRAPGQITAGVGMFYFEQ